MKDYCGKNVNNYKPRILITFRQNGENGGPFVSHKRIIESCLKDKYEFIPLMLPKPKEMLTIKGMHQIISEMRKSNADVLHFSGLQLEGFATLLIAKMAGMRNTLCAVRGSSVDAVNFPKHKKRILELLENWTLKHSDACYGVSNFVSKWPRVKKYAKNNQGYVYNLGQKKPISETEIIATQTVREELGIGSNEIVIVSTGRIIIDKGFEVLTNAIINGGRWDNVRFLIVGDGNYLNEMRQKIEETDLVKRVIFLGYRSDVDKILSESDIFIICTFHETLCNSVIEASNAGLPVVATNVGGIPEIVEDNVTGFLLENGNYESVIKAMKTLIENPDLRKKMGNAGKIKICNNFSERSITNKLSSIYESMLNNA